MSCAGLNLYSHLPAIYCNKDINPYTANVENGVNS
jgi:hypothetical protein